MIQLTLLSKTILVKWRHFKIRFESEFIDRTFIVKYRFYTCSTWVYLDPLYQVSSNIWKWYFFYSWNLWCETITIGLLLIMKLLSWFHFKRLKLFFSYLSSSWLLWTVKNQIQIRQCIRTIWSRSTLFTYYLHKLVRILFSTCVDSDKTYKVTSLNSVDSDKHMHILIKIYTVHILIT